MPESLDNIEAFGNKSRPDDTSQEYNRGRIDMPGTHDLQTDRSPPTSGLSTPQNTPPDRMEHRTPSTSKKRYSSIIEAKHRQLVEEEGLAFRASQARLHSNEGEGTHTRIHTVLWHCLHTMTIYGINLKVFFYSRNKPWTSSSRGVHHDYLYFLHIHTHIQITHQKPAQ